MTKDAKQQAADLAIKRMALMKDNPRKILQISLKNAKDAIKSIGCNSQPSKSSKLSESEPLMPRKKKLKSNPKSTK